MKPPIVEFIPNDIWFLKVFPGTALASRQHKASCRISKANFCCWHKCLAWRYARHWRCACDWRGGVRGASQNWSKSWVGWLTFRIAAESSWQWSRVTPWRPVAPFLDRSSSKSSGQTGCWNWSGWVPQSNGKKHRWTTLSAKASPCNRKIRGVSIIVCWVDEFLILGYKFSYQWSESNFEFLTLKYAYKNWHCKK